MEYELLLARLGVTDKRPVLWLCTGCRYTYWSYDEDQDPNFYLIEYEVFPKHCANGKWVADSRAITEFNF